MTVSTPDEHPENEMPDVDDMLTQHPDLSELREKWRPTQHVTVYINQIVWDRELQQERLDSRSLTYEDVSVMETERYLRIYSPGSLVSFSHDSVQGYYCVDRDDS